MSIESSTSDSLFLYIQPNPSDEEPSEYMSKALAFGKEHLFHYFSFNPSGRLAMRDDGPFSGATSTLLNIDECAEELSGLEVALSGLKKLQVHAVFAMHLRRESSIALPVFYQRHFRQGKILLHQDYSLSLPEEDVLFLFGEADKEREMQKRITESNKAALARQGVQDSITDYAPQSS